MNEFEKQVYEKTFQEVFEVNYNGENYCEAFTEANSDAVHAVNSYRLQQWINNDLPNL